MKTINKPIWHLLLYLFILSLAGSCSDDDMRRNSIGSSLKENGDHSVSSFTLPQENSEIINKDGIIYLQLTSLSDNSTLDFEGNLRFLSGNLTCEIYIPNNQEIADGDYIMWIRSEMEGNLYPQGYRLTFQEQMVSAVLATVHKYDQLQGEGTVDHPYLITSTEDFAYMVQQLLMYDSSHGKNQYFKQVADILAPVTDCLYQGNGYKCAPFAGIYDGNSKQIQGMAFTGSSTEESVGLFSTLLDGAIIRNLTLMGANIQSPGSKCGLLAGVAQGEVRIENVEVRGTINMGKDKIGGLIGYAEKAGNKQGHLTINDTKFYVTFVDNGSYVGGLVGWAESVQMDINNITTSSPFGILTGKDNTGGLIGKLYGTISANNIKLTHTTDDPNMKIITGNNRTGGLIGEFYMTNSSSLNNITINLPIDGHDEVGGLIGKLYASSTSSFTLSIDTYNKSTGSQGDQPIKGESKIGGLIGLSSAKQGNIILKLIGESTITSPITSSGKYAGGVLGQAQQTKIEFNNSAKINLNIANIKANQYAGGFAGSLENGGTINVNTQKVQLSPLMSIRGNSGLGGFSGIIVSTNLKGDYKPNFSDTDVITNNDDMSFFAGKINSDDKSSSAQYIGGIAGSVDNSSIDGFYVTPSLCGNRYVGGIAGSVNNTTVYNCAANCGVFNNGSYSEAYSLGGIIGYLSNNKACNYENLVNYTSINDVGDGIGGIIGHADCSSNITLRKVVNLKNLTANYRIGGIIGYISGTSVLKIYHSANYGDISGKKGRWDKNDAIGGIVGYSSMNVQIHNSVNHGHVTASKDYWGAGGILGYANCSIPWVNCCCNWGNIDLSRDSEKENGGIGGLIGSIEHTKAGNWNITDCYNQGTVTGQKHSTSWGRRDYRGGIVGNMGKDANCHFVINAAKVDYGNALAGYLTDKNMKSSYLVKDTGKDFAATATLPDSRKGDESEKTLYSGFDFQGTWQIGGTYNQICAQLPYLQSCYFQFAKYNP